MENEPKRKNQIIWVFGPSKAGKKTFIGNVKSFDKGSSLRLDLSSGKMYHSKESLEFVFPENHSLRDTLPHNIACEIQEINSKNNSPYSYFIKGQQYDFEHDLPKKLRALLPEHTHRIIFIYSDPNDLKSRWSKESFLGREQTIDAVQRHVTKQVHFASLLQEDNFDLQFIADKDRAYEIVNITDMKNELSVPAITVGIVFTSQNFPTIEYLLKEILSQYKETLILVYTGQNPLSPSLVSTVKNSNITLLRNTTQQELGWGINQIADLTETPWFLVLDADLYIPQGMLRHLEIMVKTLPIDNRIGAIQSLVKNENKNNLWSHYEWLGDLMSYLTDRKKSSDWFEKEQVDTTTQREITVLQGGARLLKTEVFKKIGGAANITAGVDRDLGIRIEDSGRNVLFDPKFIVFHHYPKTLIDIIRRKWKHAKGSARSRKLYPEMFKDSFVTRMKMYKSCFFPPKLFTDSFIGRIYYFFSMFTFTTGIVFYSFLYSTDGKRQLHLLIANALFVFHCFTGMLIFSGWYFPQVKIAYLCLLVGWISCWIFLGYCPLSKWEFLLRRKYDKSIDPNAEAIKYYMYKFFKIDIPARVIFTLGLVFFITLVTLTFTHHLY